MTLSEYCKHYFSMPEFIVFLVLNMVLMVGSVYIFFAYAKRVTKGNKKECEKEFYSLSERFYEIIISGASIISFIAAFYLIDRFVVNCEFRVFWDKYRDFLLLVMMIISILFNTVLDHIVVKIEKLSHEDMASIRLLGMLYMIIIFMYIKFIYEDNNYDRFIAYFLTLMIGRFVYFDASFKDFLDNIIRAAASLPLMLFALANTGIVALYGFKTGYLLKHNGVITNLFFAHLFMIVSIGILSRVSGLFLKKDDVAGKRDKSNGRRHKNKEMHREKTNRGRRDYNKNVIEDDIDIDLIEINIDDL